MAPEPTLSDLPEDEALAAEYVLGLLTADERAAFEARLRDDPVLRRRVDAWQETLLPLADAVAPVTPPAGLFSAIEGRLFPARRSDPKPGWLDSLWFWRSVSAAAAAVALVLAVAVAVDLPRPDRPAGRDVLIAQLQNDERGLDVAAYFEPGTNRLVLTRASGDPASGRAFELWIVVPEAAPVSLGTLPPESRVEVALGSDLAGRLDAGAALAISDEPAGGSPTGQPTGAILAVGPVSALRI